MLEVTKDLIKNFKVYEHGYDFMGYPFVNPNELTFHHIIDRKDCLNMGLGEGYEYWNGSILVRNTSHDYIHVIQKFDNNIYYDITSEIIDQKIKKRLDPKNIHYIDLLLEQFEDEYEGMIAYDKVPVVREEFRKRLYRR